MAMYLLPQKSGSHADPESRNPGEDSGSRNDAEEIPQPARKPARVELNGQQAPRKRGGSNESSQEAEVGRDVLDRGPSQPVILGDNCGCPPLSGEIYSFPAPALLFGGLALYTRNS